VAEGYKSAEAGHSHTFPKKYHNKNAVIDSDGATVSFGRLSVIERNHSNRIMNFKFTFLAISLLLLAGFSRAQDLVPTEKAALLHVVVTDFENNPREGEVVIFRAEASGKSVKRKTGSDGKFDILLPKGETYGIQYQDFLQKRDYSSIEIPGDDGLMEATLEVQYEDEVDQVYELDILFETDKAVIYPRSYHLLDELLELMKEQPEVVIEVAGHTDSDGSAEHNLQLSQDRAASVKDYLLTKGIAAKRVQSVGYGESKPIESNATDKGKTRNRRTEIRIVSK
jgi:outer membrane protein OmpA-like peptidoglycan-associated protein